MFIISVVYGALGNFNYYWIGGTMKTAMMNGGKSVDVWSWTKDDALMTFSDWDPSAAIMGNCTGVKNNGYWSVIDCKTRNPFVCEIPAAIDYNYEFCDDGWAHFDLTHSCYKKFPDTRSVYQSTAENLCIQQGGHLASIHSVEENFFIGQLTSIGYKTDSIASVFWIGAKRDDNSANWYWTDGSPFDYSVWGYNFHYTNHFCGEYWPDYTTDVTNNPMVWNANDCGNTLYAYLCKKKAKGSQ
uniref:C-type lectin domain-containing protein n=1 Tax=Panagrolaimus sp. JU765 TaxID=591449 RepID=A0AC34RAI1_9BILA